MSLATTQDQRDLAAAAAGFAARAEGRAPAWGGLVELGLHAVHLPDEYGGAGLSELAVIVEELGRALHPGPFLPTVLAGATLMAVPVGRRDERWRTVVAALGEGATGAVVSGTGLTATPDGEGWRLEGLGLPTIGLPDAEVVLVRARTDTGAELCCRVRPAPTATVLDRPAADGSRSFGVLRLDAHPVAASDLLPAPSPQAAELATNTLYAAEAVGLCRWLLDTATAYAKTRQQFGRPIGSFQAIQHKLAMLLVRVETAAAAAWDAVRAADAEPSQQALAAAQAALVVPPAAVEAALECVSLLGAIGFTWEHDAHRYWRRAVTIAAVVGPESTWARRLGELSGEHRRDFALVGSEALPQLRAELGPLLDRAATLPDDDAVMTGWGPVGAGPRRALLAEAGLVAPHYPAPWGRDAGPEEQAVIAQEFAARGLAQPTTVIGEWVLPTLLEHGTDEHRERFVWPTLRGDIVWCQLFSEPGAGSDLAGLTTKARRVDGGWVLSGQKVWNSYAHVADWGVCLARSDPAASRHAGISYFLVDLRSRGVEVRQIRQATGRSEFNEVFLDDVFVPEECLVGEPGGGWRLAATTLTNERLNMGVAFDHGSSDLVRRALEDGASAADPGEGLRVLGECVSREMALAALALRSTRSRLDGVDPSPAASSVQKVYNALAQRAGSRALTALLGPLGVIEDVETPYVVDHLGLPAVLFGGGTVEIQLNLIARRVLGLPGEPRPVAKESSHAP